jgi:ribonuclease E
MLRDYLTTDTGEVIVDTPAAFHNASSWFKAVMPRSTKVLTEYEGAIPLFDAYGVEQQIEAIFSRRVDLPSGGYILVDPTEALISIDVNSGRSTKQKSQEETALHTNLEAAAEVARQLRLRDLGGLIVIDFIDMVSTKQNRQVEKVLKDTLKKDKARTYVGKISENGLCEVNRQRIKQAIRLQTHIDCPACEGRGIIPSPEFAVRGLLRRIQAKAAAGKVDKVVLGLNPDIALHLLNKHRRDLSDIEDKCGILVRIDTRSDLMPSKMDIRWLSITQLSPAERGEIEAHREAILAKGQAIRNDEKPPEPLPEFVDEDEDEDGDSPKTEEKSDRKKRRRRRRRGRDKTESGETAEAGTKAEGTPEGDAEAGKSSEGEGTPEGEGEGEGDGERKKRRRRRRRRGRGRNREREEGESTEGKSESTEEKGESEAGAEASAEAAPASDGAEATNTPAGETDEDGELSQSQKRRRRRKRKRRQDRDEESEPTEVAAEPAGPAVVVEADGLDDVDSAADTLEFGPDDDDDASDPADDDAPEEAEEEEEEGEVADAVEAEETEPALPPVDGAPPGEVLIPPPADSLFE